MAELPLNQSLQQILDDGRSWVSLARVDAVAAHRSWGVLLDVTLQPRNIRAQARMLLPGSGDQMGVALPVSVGDEVLVVFPSGDPNEAVALGGLPSRPRRMPADWSNDTIRIDGGDTYDVEVRAGGTRVTVERGGDVRIEAAGDVYVDAAALIRLGGEAAVPLVRFQQLKAAFDAHVHGSAMGPTSTPAPMPPTVGTTKVKGE